MTEFPEWLEDLMRLRGIDSEDVVEFHYTKKLDDHMELTVRLRPDPAAINVTIAPVELPK